MAKKKIIAKTSPKKEYKKNIKKFNFKTFYNSKIQPLLPVLKFTGIFLFIVGCYYAFITSDYKEIMRGYLALTAKISSFLLNLLGEDTIARSQIINSARGSISIGFGCDGLDPIVIFFAAAVATPTK